MCCLEGAPVDKSAQLIADNLKLCGRIDALERRLAERDNDIGSEVERNIQLNEEIKRLREGSAIITHGLDVAAQLISALIAWLPEGQPLPENIGGLKLQLDEVWEKLHRKEIL